LLRWLKLWDHVVFGTELKPTMKNQSQANEAKLKKTDVFSANKKPADSAVNELLDDSNRPIQKVCSCALAVLILVLCNMLLMGYF